MDLIERIREAQAECVGSAKIFNLLDEAAAALRAVHQDVNELYASIPQLPVTAATCDAATDVLTRFCIDFHGYIVHVPHDSEVA